MQEEKDDSHPTKKPYGLSEETVEQAYSFLEEHNYEEVRKILFKLHYADLADFIEASSVEQRQQIIEALGENFNPQTLVEINSNVRESIIDLMGIDSIAGNINKLEPDEAIEILEDLSAKECEAILNSLPQEKQDALRDSLTYPKNSAGRLMEKLVVSVPEYWEVGQTIDYLRDNKHLPKDFHEIFVVDPKHTVIGSVLTSRVIRSSREVNIREIMKTDITIIDADMDQEEVSYIFSQYGLVSAPIVNKEARLVGVISIDEIVHVIEKEAEEDLFRMVGVNETDLHSAFFHTAKHRFPWLFTNLITACVTSLVIAQFESTIQSIVALAALMPIVASMGGNAGTQTLTVAVRAIANKDLNTKNATKVILKEMIANGFNGFFLSLFGGAIIHLWYHDTKLSLVFAISVIINFTLAGFFGSFIPIMLNKLRIDPAISSSVFLTSLTDIIGFFCFLSLAKFVLL